MNKFLKIFLLFLLLLLLNYKKDYFNREYVNKNNEIKQKKMFIIFKI